MPPPLPTLPDELVEEIFLRLPPDEPACLRRAELASKFWRGLLTGPAFRGRYRERHGDPPEVYRRSFGRIKPVVLGRTKEFYLARERREAAASSQGKCPLIRMLEDLQAAMAVNSDQVIARGRQAPPSSKHHLQLKKITKHVGVKQSPSRSNLTNVAAQPVSHKRRNAALHNVVNAHGNKVDEKTRKLHESAKKQVDVKAKVAKIDAQREGKPI